MKKEDGQQPRTKEKKKKTEDKKRPIRDGQLDDRTKVQGLYDYIIFDYYKNWMIG